MPEDDGDVAFSENSFATVPMVLALVSFARAEKGRKGGESLSESSSADDNGFSCALPLPFVGGKRCRLLYIRLCVMEGSSSDDEESSLELSDDRVVLVMVRGLPGACSVDRVRCFCLGEACTIEDLWSCVMVVVEVVLEYGAAKMRWLAFSDKARYEIPLVFQIGEGIGSATGEAPISSVLIFGRTDSADGAREPTELAALPNES